MCRKFLDIWREKNLFGKSFFFKSSVLEIFLKNFEFGKNSSFLKHFGFLEKEFGFLKKKKLLIFLGKIELWKKMIFFVF